MKVIIVLASGTECSRSVVTGSDLSNWTETEVKYSVRTSVSCYSPFMQRQDLKVSENSVRLDPFRFIVPNLSTVTRSTRHEIKGDARCEITEKIKYKRSACGPERLRKHVFPFWHYSLLLMFVSVRMFACFFLCRRF